ncbi:beta-phosphoglucomutase [Paenibacillus sambharensis]|uniref:Beta-phosphoglucomutase n=1 Tax=Paenibacillus sambharensis TaxID=1803190 RepID=A0A2W1L5A7_9BACL|nr:beta-phosphoglucomutase [Paenibacillus sambharensis]PZD94466.1 beta-phosphoglucomutase [Paenibacillus sambharensis]
MSKLLQAFIFDLDGVITESAEYHYLAWKALAEELGITFDRAFNEELKGVSRMESLEKILVLGGRQDEFTPEQKASLAAKKNDHYGTLIQQITPADILPGIAPLLAEIRSRNLKLGLASVSRNAFTVMASLGLKDEFDVIVDAAEIKRGKPDPEIFLTAAQLLGVEPSACIGVEDAVVGVEAIKGAGMFAVGIGSEETLAKADLVYAHTGLLSYAEIVEKFDQA